MQHFHSRAGSALSHGNHVLPGVSIAHCFCSVLTSNRSLDYSLDFILLLFTQKHCDYFTGGETLPSRLRATCRKVASRAADGWRLTGSQNQPQSLHPDYFTLESATLKICTGSLAKTEILFSSSTAFAAMCGDAESIQRTHRTLTRFMSPANSSKNTGRKEGIFRLKKGVDLESPAGTLIDFNKFFT